VIITGRNKLGILKERMDAIGVTGMTITYVEGYGAQKGQTTIYRGVEMESTLLPKIKVEIVVGDIPLDKVVNTAKQAIYTGSVGDGKIFIYNVAGAVRVRTGKVGKAAVSNEVRVFILQSNLLKNLFFWSEENVRFSIGFQIEYDVLPGHLVQRGRDHNQAQQGSGHGDKHRGFAFGGCRLPLRSVQGRGGQGR
jgi:nitrogen regulatory protein P-II 1